MILTRDMLLLKDIVLFVCLFKPLYLLSQMMQVVTINERSMRSEAIRFFLYPFDKVWFYFKTTSNLISYLKVCIFRLFECVYYGLPLKKYGRFTCYIQASYNCLLLSRWI